MSNLQLTYNYPWLLLLIIPAVLLTLIPYFRLDKRLRFTRNRIISMTLHITAMVLAINLLAGIGFSYEVPNDQNEVILLVDVSDSNEEHSDDMDAFVSSVIDVCAEDCRIGIVKFGYGCEYAVELTSDKESVLEKYLVSEDPDGSATALADALKYTASLFTNRKTSKIVVISDGLETDGDALLALNDIVAAGSLVDAVPIPKEQETDIQLISASTEEKDIVVGEDFIANIVLNSNSSEDDEAAVLRLYDNGELYGETFINIANGVNELPVSLSLSQRGMHELLFELITDYDLLGEPLRDDVPSNNSYRMYINLPEFENILLIERYEDESEKLKDIISKTKRVTDISVEEDIADFPKTIADMAKYEQIILVNIAYSDMPAGFEELLNRYVYDLGGGLLTVGGINDENGGVTVPHAYNRSDIANSVYFKQMLPVNAEDYTPPIAVMIAVDVSTSLNHSGKLEAAVDGAMACLDALHDRDFCGIMSFSSESSEELSVLPVSQRDEIEEAIKKLKESDGGGTEFADAIMNAGRALSVIDNVERRHIILVTDGLTYGDAFQTYSGYIEDNIADGITMSIITIGLDSPTKEKEMQDAAALGGGKFYNVSDTKTVSDMMYKDLTQEAIAEIFSGEEFSLYVKDESTILTGIDTGAIPVLSGYYGTAAKKDAAVPLMGKQVPIYATHKYGNGTVGSFMCDLNGTWSAAFIDDVVGKALIMNIVESIFPLEDVRADGIKYELRSDNYSHWLNIYGAEEGQSIEVSVDPLSEDLMHLRGEIDVSAAENNRRFTFKITEPGLYEIKIRSLDESGAVTAEIPIYEAFSYSEEYDTFARSTATGEELMTLIAEEGGGVVVSDPADVFNSFSKTIVMSYDPRLILLIAAIVLFLLDIAVRKFKFKWIHELIRERKENKL